MLYIGHYGITVIINKRAHYGIVRRRSLPYRDLLEVFFFFLLQEVGYSLVRKVGGEIR